MTTTSEVCPLVPASYIKNKAYDGDGEIWSIAGGGISVFGLRVKAPSLGVFSLLESYESPFIAHPEDCTLLDVWRVLYINDRREKCVQEVMDWAYPSHGSEFVHEDTTTWREFDHNAFAFGAEHYDENTPMEEIAQDVEKLYKWFLLAFEGFEMIPGGGSGAAWWFGAETIGSMAAALSARPCEILWDLPLCFVGHAVASHARMNGNNNVKRPKDVADMKEKFEEAKDRERNGVMHPWQVENPEAWPLTEQQIKYKPTIQKEWDRLLKERKNVKA